MYFVYSCRIGENEELRYSIRSVLKNVPESQIIIVGGKPSWYKGKHIPVPQKAAQYHNVMSNLHAILNDNSIPEDFIYMNDDFFIMKPIDKIPIFYDGMLFDKVNAYEILVPTSSYTRRLRNTQNKLNSLGFKTPLNYELHTPFNVNKTHLEAIIRNKDTKTLWRSLYGNIHKIGGENTRDVKVYNKGILKKITYEIDDNTIFISTEDNMMDYPVGDIIRKKFKKMSKLESK